MGYLLNNSLHREGFLVYLLNHSLQREDSPPPLPPVPQFAVSIWTDEVE